MRVDANRVAVHELAFEQPKCEWVLDEPLDRTLEGSGTVRRIPAGLRKRSLRVVRELELDAAFREPRAQALELQVDDLCELVLRQRLELDDLVDPVEELGPEELAHLLLRAQVRGHDQHGVAEVDGAALSVGEPAVVEDLQQHVEDLVVRLLDLVEEDHRVRTAAHRFRQLSPLLVADVAGRRADQTRDRVPLLVLGHVEPHQRALVVEHELRERPRKLGFADASRPEEHERADRPVRILQARPRTA